MAWVTEDFLTTWAGGDHLGASSPRSVIEVCRGTFSRGYHDWSGTPVRADIPGEDAGLPWFPIWTQLTDWTDVPNIGSVQLTQSLDQNGITVATITIDAVGYPQATSSLGPAYHVISPGYLAPQRGYDPPTRRASGLAANEWSGMLTDMANLRIWQGYGEPDRDLSGEVLTTGGANGAWVFNGIIDEVDLEGTPNTVTIVARMGKQLTDQRVFGWNKSRQLKDPVTFISRAAADETSEEGYRAEASTGSNAKYVLDQDTDDAPTRWFSAGHTDGANTEWVEIRVPQGRYETFWLDCAAAAGMTMYVGFFLHSQTDDDGNPIPPQVDGVDADTGWWNGGFSDPVPGTFGGWDYVMTGTTTTDRVKIDMGHEFEVGKNSILRLGFRELYFDGFSHVAEVRELHAVKRTTRAEVANSKLIVVQDVSDMVRVALRWAGYDEWDIEDAGVSLKGRFVINRASYLIDIITAAVEQTGFVFFIADPVDGNSFGIPTFRRNAALLRDNGYIAAELDDNNTIGDIKVAESDEARGYIIRVRGKEAAAKDGGLTLGGNPTRRLMFIYRPPWTTGTRMGGILRHVTHHDDALLTIEDCQVGAYLIAAAEALAIYTATAELPGNPLIELDDQVGVMSETTGVNSRLWVISRESTMNLGKTTNWKFTLGGSLIDTPDLVSVIDDILSVDWSSDATPIVVNGSRPPRIRDA